MAQKIWTAYCPENKKVELITFIEKVKIFILNFDDMLVGYSLSDGLPGIVSFLELYGEFFNDGTSLKAAKRLLKKILLLNKKQNTHSYFGGKSGALSLFTYSSFQEDQKSQIKIEDSIITHFIHKNKIKKLEWINGLAGLGNYSICRHQPNFILSELIATAIIDGVKVRSDRTLDNLGLAHGIPGIITFLSDYLTISGNSIVTPYIIDLVSIVISNRINKTTSFYSYTCEQKNTSRLGWCYGDLSIAISMIHAGSALKEENIMKHGIELIEHSANRDVSSSGVSDASLCHGSLGLAHIFQHCYVKTGCIRANEAAVYWLVYFIEKQSCNLNKYFSSIGFLEGLTGAALAALSSLCDEDPLWEHVLTGYPLKLSVIDNLN